MTPDELLVALTEASAGLLFPSETDSPLMPYWWDGPGDPSPEELLRAGMLPPDTPVEIADVRDFFEGVTEPPPCPSEEEIAEAERWQKLVDLLERELSDLCVYRVGEVDIDVFVLGRHPSGEWLGLETSVVET